MSDQPSWATCPQGDETGTPLPVYFRWTVNKLSKIDTVNQCACVDLVVTLYWTDRRMAQQRDEQHDELPDDLWGPTLSVRARTRAAGMAIDLQTGEITRVHGDSDVLQRRVSLTGFIHNPMNLADFPFDTDSVAVELYTGSHWKSNRTSAQGMQPWVRSYVLRPVTEGGSELARLNTGFVSLWWDGKVDEFRVHGISTAIEQRPVNVDDRAYTNIKLAVHVSRSWGFFFWKVMLPILMLALLSFSTYGFETSDFAGRSSNVATYFLAAFAMLYVVGEHLPKTDFLTKIDEAIVLTMMTLISSGVASQVVAWLHEHHGAELAVQWNIRICVGSAATFVVGILWIFLPAWWRQKVMTKELNLLARIDRGDATAPDGVERSTTCTDRPINSARKSFSYSAVDSGEDAHATTEIYCTDKYEALDWVLEGQWKTSKTR